MLDIHYFNKAFYLMLLGFVFIIVIAGCDKNNPEEIAGDCPEIVSESSFGYYLMNYPDYNYIRPCFNPNNSSEFVYIRWNTNTQEQDLFVYNFLTDTSTLVLNNVSGRPQWSALNWILVEHNGNEIWKVKPNGDSLEQLTYDEGGLLGASFWNGAGTQFIYYKNYIDSTHLVICDLSGNQISSYGISLDDVGAWYPSNNKILATNDFEDYGFSYYDTLLNSNISILKLPYRDNDDLIQGLCWISNESAVLWATGNTVSRTDVVSSQTIEILRNCDEQVYQYPSINSIEDRILFEKVITFEVSEIELDRRYIIVSTNMLGGDEQVILE